MFVSIMRLSTFHCESCPILERSKMKPTDSDITGICKEIISGNGGIGNITQVQWEGHENPRIQSEMTRKFSGRESRVYWDLMRL